MRRFLGLIFCSVLGLAGHAGAEPFRVVTSVNLLSQPLSDAFAAEIDQGLLTIEPLMDVGSDPHLYVPTRLDLSKILDADLVLFIGLGLEAQFDDVLRRASRRTTVVFVGNGVPKNLLIGTDCAFEHDDAAATAEQSHLHPNCLVDPHIWMAPKTFMFALGRGAHALTPQFPEGSDRAIEDIVVTARKLHRSVNQLVDDAQVELPMITAHDAFGYYADAFDVETLGLAGISTDVEPSVRRVQQLADRIVADQVPAIFLESSVPPRGIRTLLEAAKARGQDVEIRGPLYTDSIGPAGSGAHTWANMLMANTFQIVCALGKTPPKECP